MVGGAGRVGDRLGRMACRIEVHRQQVEVRSRAEVVLPAELLVAAFPVLLSVVPLEPVVLALVVALVFQHLPQQHRPCEHLPLLSRPPLQRRLPVSVP